MKRIYKKYKILIFLCLLCLIVNVYVKIDLLANQSDRIASLQKMTSRARMDNDTAAGRQGDKKTDVSIHLSKLMSTIETRPHLVQYTDRIAKLIDKNRVTLKENLVFEIKEAEMPFLVKYDSLFTVEGSYENIKRFISDIQNTRALFYVRSADMAALETDSQKLALHMGISVYFKKEQA